MIIEKKKPDSTQKVEKILNPTIRKWFYKRFKEFSIPQQFGVSEIHSRNNTLILAPTGSTKTLTGFLSVLNELVDSAQKGILKNKVYCIYISPLKALNEDIKVNLIEPLGEINKIHGSNLGIKVSVRTGDTSTKEKSKMLKESPHILITTPESLAIMLASPKFVKNLDEVQWCIIDEIHALAENKRGVHLSLSLENLQNICGYITRVGLSATVSPREEIAKYLVGYENNKLRPCKIIDVQFIKNMDLKVISPVKDLINTSHITMHKKLYELIHELIQKHKTTLIFTNTRSATERVVDKLKNTFPKFYSVNNIGAHHGSLSKDLRHLLEQGLREGKYKCVVSSTSLELGIDIGYIDLVILLGSPKTVARALQRIGRSGHHLNSITKGRMIIMDRDDLVECSVLLKDAIEKKIDEIHIPTNCLDVLAQQMFGIIIRKQITFKELYKLIKQSYCYHDLNFNDYLHIIEYLAGKYELEDRHIYAKIWWDEKTGLLTRRGKMGRVIYMTNIGTIPDESFITVKIGTQIIGYLDEGFIEKMKPGDVFVLGGSTYLFKFSRGNVAQVSTAANRPPTIPSWFSETLPLSFDLAKDIGKFRRLIQPKLKNKTESITFIHDYLYVDKNAANSIYSYINEQNDFIDIPTDKKIIIESYDDGFRKYEIFHSLFGRKINDCLSRALAYAIARTEHIDVEMGINDNSFYVASHKKINALKAFKLLKSSELYALMNNAIEKNEIFKRRFRHCATRSLMILRNYKGKNKRVGRQQVSSMILMSALKRISNDFIILKEAKREVLEDSMDIKNATKILQEIENNKIKIINFETKIPSPFAFNIIIQGYSDIMKMEDKIEFLKKVHNLVKAKIQLNKGKTKK